MGLSISKAIHQVCLGSCATFSRMVKLSRYSALVITQDASSALESGKPPTQHDWSESRKPHGKLRGPRILFEIEDAVEDKVNADCRATCVRCGGLKPQNRTWASRLKTDMGRNFN
jgi:hypothetical protein